MRLTDARGAPEGAKKIVKSAYHACFGHFFRGSLSDVLRSEHATALPVHFCSISAGVAFDLLADLKGNEASLRGKMTPSTLPPLPRFRQLRHWKRHRLLAV